MGVKMPKLIIRELYLANERCLQAVNKLIPQLSKTAKPVKWDHLRAVTRKEDSYLFVIKDVSDENDNFIAGMAMIFFQPIPTGWLGEIHDVVVDDFYKGQKLGKKLVANLLEKAKEKAKRVKMPIKLSLTSKPDREAANAMYQKFGFKLAAPSEMDHAGNPVGTNLYKLTIEP